MWEDDDAPEVRYVGPRNFSDIIDEVKKTKRRESRRKLNLHVSFQGCDKDSPSIEDDLLSEGEAKRCCDIFEYDKFLCVQSIHDDEVGEGYDYTETPWYEEEEEEIPWWEMPDLDEDDEITALCKKVVDAGIDYDARRRAEHAERIEIAVCKFALNLKNKVASRKHEEQLKLKKQKNGKASIPTKGIS